MRRYTKAEVGRVLEDLADAVHDLRKLSAFHFPESLQMELMSRANAAITEQLRRTEHCLASLQREADDAEADDE